MKVLKVDEREPVVKVIPESLEDLWYLTKVLQEGDEASASSFRSFKVQGKLRAETEKKKVHLRLKLERIEFSENANRLRLTGVIVSGTPEEFVQSGNHHTIDLEIRRPLEMHKVLNSFEKSVLQEAKARSVHVTLLIIAVDDKKATIAELQTRGLKFTAEIENKASKRQPETFDKKNKEFFEELYSFLEKLPVDAKAIIAGPGFTKDAFKAFLANKNAKLAPKVFFEHASNAERSAVHEVIKSGLVDKAVAEQKMALEFQKLEEFKKRVAKGGGDAVYGLNDVKQAVESGAVSVLMVSDSLLRKKDAQDLHKLLDQARRTKAELVVFDSDGDAGKEFAAYKIAALLRFKLNY
ncbi:MAG: mRNA surveillance protein pelota [Candidatus Micrarchaeota archaeon]